MGIGHLKELVDYIYQMLFIYQIYEKNYDTENF